MIHLLIKYAQEHGLESEPGFKVKDVRWAVCFAEDGQFLDVVELGDVGEKRSRGQQFPRCPDFSQGELVAGGVTRSHFLIETAAVIALYNKKGEEDEGAKNQDKHAFFVKLLREVEASMPVLGRLAQRLDDADTLSAIRARFKALKVKPTDKVTPQIGGRFPVESNTWHDWWREFRAGLAASRRKKNAKTHAPATMRSFVSGQVVSPARTHPKISGRGTGNALVSFDKGAFASYGLEKSANAALSEVEAFAYRDAFERLLDETGQRLAGAEVIHWFKGRAPPKEDDPLAWLVEPPKQQEGQAQRRARELLSAIRQGKRPDLGGNLFYALMFSRVEARIMVRDWMEGRFEDLVQSVEAWFSDQAVVRLDGERPAANPRMEGVVTSLLSGRKPGQKYDDWIKPIGADRLHLWRAALHPKQPIPYTALARLVRVNALFHQTKQLEEALKQRRGSAVAITRARLYARMGLMRAYHVRKGDANMSPGLNPQHPDPAYHCGRIMAVLAKLQRAALGDVGAGVVQRYYAAASATPALVLGRLIRNSQFHLSALGKEKRGLAIWFEKQLQEVNDPIQDRYPAVLDLERQSLFALGYYHQLAYRAAEEPAETQLTEEESHD